MNEDIIEAVKTEMKNNNIKTADLCRDTGLSRQTLYNIVNGRRSGINLGTLCKTIKTTQLKIQSNERNHTEKTENVKLQGTDKGC